MVEPADDVPAAGLRSRYEAFRSLLDRNGALLELLAELELDLRMLVPGDSRIWARLRGLLEGTLLQIQTLNLLSDGRHGKLYRVHDRIERHVWGLLRRLHEECQGAPLTVPLAEVTREDVHVVGGKAARLGDLAGGRPESVPAGFVVTTPAYSRFLAHGEAGARLREILQDLDVIADPAQLKARVARARDLVLAQPVPEEVSRAIEEAARRLRVPSAGGRWAVRSSAVGEDGPMSFAGQFDSILDVPEDEIVAAWRRVVASVFSPRAVSYRLACGVAELSTPMAVLCMPMVHARWAGVMHTHDPTDPGAETMLISAVEGRGAELVGGEVDGQAFQVSRNEPVRVLEGAGGASSLPAPDGSRLEGTGLSLLVALGRAAEEHFEGALEVEWAIDGAGSPLLLQARPLTTPRPAAPPRTEAIGPVLAEGGTPIVIGRAVGQVCCVEAGADPDEVPRGSVLVVPHAAPEFGHLLPRVEGLIAEHGSFASHLASLAREFGVPSVFGMVGAASRLPGSGLVSLDAGRCKVYGGNAWADEVPAVRQLERERRATSMGPLHRLVLGLELTDPRAPNFRPGGCRSIHDLVRFCHERGIAALFEAGAWADRPDRSGAQRLVAPQLPNQIWVLDVGGGVAMAARGRREVAPGDVISVPFRALWRGMTAPGVEWRGRTGISLRGFASVVSSSLLEAEADPSALAAAAYMIVASHHLNLNARLAYHYAMIDARVDEVSESNHVRFRFWGGGARPTQRDLRALFLARVLGHLGFIVERRGDLVAAALLRHPVERSEQALAALGALMGCARQLDMLLDSDARVEHYVERFLAGDHEAFA